MKPRQPEPSGSSSATTRISASYREGMSPCSRNAIKAASTRATARTTTTAGQKRRKTVVVKKLDGSN